MANQQIVLQMYNFLCELSAINDSFTILSIIKTREITFFRIFFVKKITFCQNFKAFSANQRIALQTSNLAREPAATNAIFLVLPTIENSIILIMRNYCIIKSEFQSKQN